jgi:preprotein translocase subunit SecA
MNMQRNAIYGMRRKVLEGQEIERTVLDMLSDVVTSILDTYLPEERRKEEWNLEGLNNTLEQMFGFKIDLNLTPQTAESITQAISEGVKKVYESQKQAMGNFFVQLQKMVLLQAIDHHWKNHLLVIDKLKEGISLRGYAQKDPLIEYKKEAFNTFEALNETIKKDAIEKIMRVQLVADQSQEDTLESFRPESTDLDELNYSAPSEADIGSGMAREASASAEAPKRKMTFTSGPADDQKLNRAQRRRQGKK